MLTHRAHRGPYKFPAPFSRNRSGLCCRAVRITNFLVRDLHVVGPRGSAGREMQRYDIRDDETLSSLQTTTNEEGADRDRAVYLRQACLAGVTGKMPQLLDAREGFVCAVTVPRHLVQNQAAT